MKRSAYILLIFCHFWPSDSTSFFEKLKNPLKWKRETGPWPLTERKLNSNGDSSLAADFFRAFSSNINEQYERTLRDPLQTGELTSGLCDRTTCSDVYKFLDQIGASTLYQGLKTLLYLGQDPGDSLKKTWTSFNDPNLLKKLFDGLSRDLPAISPITNNETADFSEKFLINHSSKAGPTEEALKFEEKMSNFSKNENPTPDDTKSVKNLHASDDNFDTNLFDFYFGKNSTAQKVDSPSPNITIIG